MYSRLPIHHIIRLLRSLISGWSVACLLHINFHLAQRVGEYVNITSRERMASNDVTNADASATPDKKFFKRFLYHSTLTDLQVGWHNDKASNEEITTTRSTIAY